MNEVLAERKPACLRIQQRSNTATAYVPISEIKVGVRFRKNLGDISALASSIKKVGLLHPIVVSEDNELIAGLRRLRACQSLGWKDVPVRVVSLAKPQDGEVEENLKRKNFTASEIVAIKRAMEPRLRAAAKKRQLTGKPCAESARSRDKIARMAGVSHDTVAKAEKIVRAAEKSPKKYGRLLAKVDEGELSVNSAYKKITKEAEPEVCPVSPGQKGKSPTDAVPISEVLLTNDDLSPQERRILERLRSIGPRPTSLKALVLTIIYDYCRRVGGEIA